MSVSFVLLICMFQIFFRNSWVTGVGEADQGRAAVHNMRHHFQGAPSTAMHSNLKETRFSGDLEYRSAKIENFLSREKFPLLARGTGDTDP